MSEPDEFGAAILVATGALDTLRSVKRDRERYAAVNISTDDPLWKALRAVESSAVEALSSTVQMLREVTAK